MSEKKGDFTIHQLAQPGLPETKRQPPAKKSGDLDKLQTATDVEKLAFCIKELQQREIERQNDLAEFMARQTKINDQLMLQNQQLFAALYELLGIKNARI